MLVKSQSIYLKFNTQTLINNRRYCPGKNISTQEQTSCEMLLCVFRSLEEVKSSNHVHITVVHNVPARKNYISDCLYFALQWVWALRNISFVRCGQPWVWSSLCDSNLSRPGGYFIDILSILQTGWRKTYKIHFGQNQVMLSSQTTVKTEIFSIILYFVWKGFLSALVWWFQRFKIM